MIRTNKKPTALLIDGNSLAYRAFFALPDTMKTSTGLTTNAIYGFTNLIIKALQDKPDYAAVAFDRKEPTFRHLEYKEYKATRDKAAPALIEQLPYVREAAKAMGLPVFELEGYEADDLIGTLAKKCEKDGYQVIILSGDKDSLQLINDNIKLMTTGKGLSETVIFDKQATKERYGLDPEQMIDYKALKGDASDNIPGIKGIGEKTAVELLQQFKTLDNLLQHPEDIKKDRIRKLVTEGKAQALMSRKLGTIVTNAPLEAEIVPVNIDIKAALPFFEKMEFNSLVKKYSDRSLESVLQEKRAQISKFNFKGVQTEAELEALIEKLSNCSAFAFDTETTGLDHFTSELVGISFCVKYGEAFYIPLSQLDLNFVMQKLKPIFASDKLKIGHNIKYDIKFMEKYGVKVAPPYFDTMIAGWLIDPTTGGYGLKKMGSQYLGRSEMITLAELLGKESLYKNFTEVPIDLAIEYGASDADVTFGLYEKLAQELKLKELEKLFYEIEMPLIEVLIEMEQNGVALDCEKLKQMSVDLQKDLAVLEKDIICIAGEEFNLNSPKQLSYILFEKLQIPISKKTKTGASTNAEVLEDLAEKFEIAQKLLEYRQLSKLKSTYVDVLPTLVNPQTGRVHTSFNQTGTATGRLSSSDPNLQNIPMKLRSAFIPGKKGWLILAADYSQVELRILAHLSKDPAFIKSFTQDQDIHRDTAAEIFGVSEEQVTDEMRSAAKTVNFGIIYGISEFGLAKQLKIKKTEAGEFINKYLTTHHGVKEFMEQTVKEAQKTGLVKTMLGRIRPLPDINSPNYGLRSFTERTAINTPVQGTAADMIKVAMVNIHKRHLGASLLLQIHDELVFEVPPEEVDTLKEIVKQEMENALKLDIPIKVDIGVGNNWAEAK